MGAKSSSQVRVMRASETLEEEDAETGGLGERGTSGRGVKNSGSAPRNSFMLGGDDGYYRAVRISSMKGEDERGPVRIVLHQAADNGGYELEDQQGSRKRLSTEVVNRFKQRNSETLRGSLAFVPWILQQSYFEGGLDDGKIVMHRGTGAVVFSDASGFTALTERLAKRSNGAELLSQCLTAFFTPLINLINSYRGDVIKFSGDALTIYFPAVDDSKAPRSRMQVPPHGSYGLPDLGPMATAVLRAAACCIEIHKRLHMFDTGVDGVKLCLHIGVGCGQVAILQVGGAVPPETHVPRFEYIIAGNPIEQISIAEPLAKNGETCLSPQAWDYVKDCVIEDTSRPLDNPSFHLLLKLDEQKFTFPTVKYSAMERDTRHEAQFKMSELNVIRRYIPSAVFKQIEGGTLTYVNEMRDISTIFISGSGVDVSADDGALVAQDLMSSIQRICYSHEGTLNKFVIDDKGMLFLLVFGLPPLVHTDDPTRAVLSCLEMVKTFQSFQLCGRFGVTTGRNYCGCCGSAQRMEYTVLGDAVNLSARLMANAPQDGVLCDEATRRQCTREILCEELTPIKVKGKANPIPIFKPTLKGASKEIGIKSDGFIKFPWYDRPASMAQQTSMDPGALEAAMRENVTMLCSLKNWDPVQKVQSFLGGTFDADLHRKPVPLPRGGSKADPAKLEAVPEDSPFHQGGCVFFEGTTGIGKIELAEHMVTYAAVHLSMLPVFGTVGPRVSDPERLGVELLRSTISIFRHLDTSMPADEVEALRRILPQHMADSFALMRDGLEGRVLPDQRQEVLGKLVDTVALLLEQLRKKTSILIVLQMEYGTNLFVKTLESFKPFWTVVTTLAKVAEVPQSSEDKPVVLALLVKTAEKSHPIVRRALHKTWFIEMHELHEAIGREYIAKYLRAPYDMVPPPLMKFIYKVSLGNPLYIRECVDQLLKNEYITLGRGPGGQVEKVSYTEDLESINIANWGQTAMVGNTICELESLAPLQAAVLKMGTCFTGPFTLPDLAASSCSRWAGATHFDYLRLYRAIQDLVNRGMIEIPQRDSLDECPSPVSPQTPQHIAPMASMHFSLLQTFEMRNMLVRKVAGSMVLEAQRKVVKRQALVERALARHLPARMEELHTKRLEPHIPWYYENVLAKGA